MNTQAHVWRLHGLQNRTFMLQFCKLYTYNHITTPTVTTCEAGLCHFFHVKLGQLVLPQPSSFIYLEENLSEQMAQISTEWILNQQCHNTEGNTKQWPQPAAWPYPFFCLLLDSWRNGRGVAPFKPDLWRKCPANSNMLVHINTLTCIQTMNTTGLYNLKSVSMQQQNTVKKFSMPSSLWGTHVIKTMQVCEKQNKYVTTWQFIFHFSNLSVD